MFSTEWQPGMTLEQVEKAVILKAFRHYGGVQTATASALGVSVRTIRNKLVSYGMKGLKDDDGNELGGDAGNADASVGVGHGNDETQSGRSANNGGEGQGAEPQPNAVRLEAGVRMEPPSQVPPQRAVPVREREEVQEMSSRSTSARHSQGRRR